MTLEKGLAAFLDAMLGRNRSTATLRAYRTDVLQFITFLHENNVAITGVGDVGKVDVLEYLAALARKGLTGVARARKVSAIREYFPPYCRYFCRQVSGYRNWQASPSETLILSSLQYEYGEKGIRSGKLH